MTFYSDTQTPSHVAWLVNALSGVVVARVRQLAQAVKSRRDAATGSDRPRSASGGDAGDGIARHGRSRSRHVGGLSGNFE